MFLSLVWAVRRAASFTLLLLMASIRLMRPMASLGEMGFVSSFRSAIFASSFAFSECKVLIIFFRSSGVIDHNKFSRKDRNVL